MKATTPNFPTEESIADLLQRAVDLSAEGPVSVGQILGTAGPRGHALALAVFSLPEALPIPIAGFSALLAVPLILISGHLLLAGSHKPLPEFLLRRQLDSRLVRVAFGKAKGTLRRLESVSRPRLTSIARRDRVLGGASLLLALIVALPIPFWNMMPALCLLLISLGMLQRDGLFALAGLLGLLAMLLAAMLMADRLNAIIQQ